MSDKIDKEIDAIKTILKTLEELEDDVRKNVLDYVLKRIKFDIAGFVPEGQNRNFTSNFGDEKPFTPIEENKEIHIKQFKEGKSPKSAIEMAAIVAYHLQYNVGEVDRKEKIGVGDLETWFRIADYPLPKGDMRFLLVNTKNAGYFDSVGGGEYKLNAVGYNLVRYNLPKGEGQSTPRRSKKAVKKAVKKAPKKSTKK